MPERCPGCGLEVDQGREGCQAVYDNLAARALNDVNYARAQTLAFDTYCMQHLETYCRSAKSYAAHLTRLCCGLEHDGDERIYIAIQRWLNGTMSLARPNPPPSLGSLTVGHAAEADSSAAFTAQVRAWAEDVWRAYTPQHKLAHTWLLAAVQSSDIRLRRGLK